MESPMPAAPLASLQTVGQARAELEARLTAIHNDLELTQSIGLLFVKRQEDLRHCFEQLEELNDLSATPRLHQQRTTQSADSGDSGSEAATQQPLPELLREQLAMIDKDFQEGQNGILGLKGLIDAQLPTIEIQPPQNDALPRSGSSVLGPSALPSSALPAQNITKPRRHKVVVPSAPSINDPAFPVQIQEELLNQVRYWTSQAEMKEKLNQDYDAKITEMERIIEALNKQRRMREESDERQKEDQWNIELMNQELQSQNIELQQQLSRAVHENSKIQKALSVASEQLDQLKDKEERTAGQLELIKSRHEQDMMAMRKHTTGIQRDKSDLLKKMEELNATMAQQRQKLVKLATMESLALAKEKEDQKPESPVETPILIQAPPRLVNNDELVSTPMPANNQTEPKIASLARETSFAHQQSIISELQSKLSQEITAKEQLMAAKEELQNEKEELAKMLADREETIETMRIEGTMGGFDASAPPQIATFGQITLDSEATHGPENTSHGLDVDLYGSDDLPVLRPSSSKHAGGLFAELAQAKTTVEPVKPSVECKDQEAMTEPIESWIHTIPGLALVPAAITTTPLLSETAPRTASTSATKGTVPTSAELEAITTVVPVLEKTQTETNTVATNTDEKSLADSTTSTEDLPTPAASVPAIIETKVAPVKTLVDNTTSTDDLPKPALELAPIPAVVQQDAPTKTLVDNTTSTDDLPVLGSAPAISKVLTDSSTLTDDYVAPVAQSAPIDITAPAAARVSVRNEALTDIITRKASTQVKFIGGSIDSPNVEIPTATVSGLEVASVRIPEILDEVQEIAQVKPQQPTHIDVQLEDESLAPEEAKVVNTLELETTEPVPRFIHSDIPVDDERRHTCDMSQSMTDMPSSQSVPPVPAIPKGITQRPELVVATETQDDDQEFRVSFGSAFGSNSSAAIVTGQIEPIYSTAQSPVAIASRGRERLSHYQQEQESDSEDELERTKEMEEDIKTPSPGRPATRPPSNLLARAARTSMALGLDTESLDGPLTNSNSDNKSSADLVNGASNTNTIDHRPLNPALPSSSSIVYPVRTASIRSLSLRSVRGTNSSSPPPHSRLPMTTGAAVISGTTRTAYTFSNSSSQIHMPQGQSQSQSQSLQHQPPYQHITDSSGASIGRPRYRPSPSGSVSSMSTDYGGPQHDRRLSVSSTYDSAPTATDPTMIQLITQTMIGDYLWKYTRRPMASVISEKKHRRYFWVHPYTKTMYWSLNNPAADGSREQRAKSALIINVYQITDENPSSNSDLPNVSLLVQTSNRNLKLTAPTRQKHELWYQSLAYLLSRPTTPGADIASDNQTWSEVQATRGVTSDALLTIRNDKSVRKKGSFNRLQNMFGRSKDNSPSGSPQSSHASVYVAPGSGSGLNSNMSSLSATGVATTSNGASQGHAPVSSGSSNGSGGASVVNSVVEYPRRMVNTHSAVGGYGTMNGGPIMSQNTSSLGTNASPKSKLMEAQHGYEDDYYGGGEDDGDEEEDDEEDDLEDGELPEHVRQCCDGKHDIGALHRH
ncbi:hypothetical protein EDD11_008533 [Mortierella claussenii]|nr:hypothetical protein EDD11_008533 [Mortierella claussenii]